MACLADKVVEINENSLYIGKVDRQKFMYDCSPFSGGNKRKLSVGLALVGGPPILLMV